MALYREGQREGGALTIRVFLLDDHEVVRRGVAALLEAESDIEVVGEAATAAHALARIPAVRPDVAVLDVRLPDGDGVSVCREIRSRLPGLACLMLTSFSDEEALFTKLDMRRRTQAAAFVAQLKASEDRTRQDG
jgi:CheY-like chemotaxis protein